MPLTAILPTDIRKRFESIQGGESLTAKVFRGGAWLGSASFIEQLIRFGRTVILARLLAPEAFGTMAIVLSVTTFVTTLTDIGVRDAIIQNPKGEDEKYVSVAYWLSFGRALLLSLSLLLAAPWVARFYGDVQLSSLLRFACLGVAIGGAGSPGMFVDMKRLKFKRWALVNHGGGIAGVIITVVLSVYVRDVWALVFGSVAENLARTVLSFILYPYKPSLVWSREAYRDLIQFSKGLFGLSFLNLVFARADIIVLGKLFSSAELGLYTMAVYLVQTPTGFLMNVFGQTLLPTFAHIQKDKVRENRILLQITYVIVLLGMPLLVFLYFCGHSVLRVAYGHRYAAAAGALVLAGCVALINLANAQITTVFYARGVPQLHRRAVAIMAVTMVLLIYPAAKLFGLVGGQIASLAAVVLGLFFQVARIRVMTGMALARYGGIFLLAAGVSLVVPVLYLSPRFFVSINSPISNIVLGAAGCLLAYLFAGAVMLRKRAQE